MAGIQYCTQYLNECGWMKEHDQNTIEKFVYFLEQHMEEIEIYGVRDLAEEYKEQIKE